MTLPVFTTFILGAFLEIIALQDHNHNSRTNSRLITPNTINRRSLLTMGGLILAGLALAVIYLTGLSEIKTSLDDLVPAFIFTIGGLYIFFMGAVSSQLLPRVNEQSILAVFYIILFSQLANSSIWQTINTIPGYSDVYDSEGFLAQFWAHFQGILFWLVLTITLSIFLLRDTPIGLPGKAILYLAYLSALIFQATSNGSLEYFQMEEISISNGFLFGGIFVFFILHGLFTARFFLVVCSLVLPRNHILARPMINRIFNDEQTSPRKFLFFTCLILLLTIANAIYQWVSPGLFMNVLTMISVQWFYRPNLSKVLSFQPTQKGETKN